MILFICSLAAEKKALQQVLQAISKSKYDILITGVWVYHTIFSLMKYLRIQTPDIIVNVGICGRQEHISTDWVQIYRIKHLGNEKEALCPVYADIFPLQSLWCSDTIVTETQEMQWEVLVDMESFGVHFVCQREKIPFLICKKPFDVVSPDSKKIDIAQIVQAITSFPIESIFEKIEYFLTQNTFISSDDITHISQKHRLTWSEKQMLQFAVNRAIACGWKREEIFQELAGKNKTELRAWYKSKEK